jgi:hypothetical protein
MVLNPGFVRELSSATYTAGSVLVRRRLTFVVILQNDAAESHRTSGLGIVDRRQL